MRGRESDAKRCGVVASDETPNIRDAAIVKLQLMLRLVAAIASGILLALANSLEPLWWAAWLAPILLLAAAFRSSYWQSWACAAIVALIGVTGKIGYDLMFVGIAGEAIIMVISIVATDSPSSRPWLDYGAPAIVVIAVLAFGVARLAEPQDAKSVAVGLAVSDSASPLSRAPIDPADTVWTSYAKTIPELSAKGARFVVWPEKIAPLDAPAAKRVKKLLGDAARANKICFVVGLTLRATDHLENRAWLFAPSGELRRLREAASRAGLRGAGVHARP